jgi:hypothetical protein
MEELSSTRGVMASERERAIIISSGSCALVVISRSRHYACSMHETVRERKREKEKKYLPHLTFSLAALNIDLNPPKCFFPFNLKLLSTPHPNHSHYTREVHPHPHNTQHKARALMDVDEMKDRLMRWTFGLRSKHCTLRREIIIVVVVVVVVVPYTKKNCLPSERASERELCTYKHTIRFMFQLG